MQSVRPDAPWCPDNIEFIRRINGLGSVDDVQNIIFDASYLVLGLGDVYLGAPVATPTDPRHLARTMPQSLSAVYLHAVFSTKDRRPFLRDPALRASLHEYLGGISKRLECAPLRIGGVEDHVHLLIGLRATHCLADVVRDIKANSSRWANDAAREKGFQWQEGYGAFTVSAMLTKKVEYDERYLW